MQTTKDKLREALRTVDWFAITYPDGLDILADRIDQHIGQRDLYATGQTDEVERGPLCSEVSKTTGDQCQREANGTDGLCGTHRRWKAKAA